MRKAYFILLLFLVCLGDGVFSQSKSKLIDSLEIALKNNQEQRVIAHKKEYYKIDTSRVNTLNLLVKEFIVRTDYKTAELLLNEALEIAIIRDFKKGQVITYNNFGALYRRKSEYPLALQNLEKALKIAKTNGFKEGLATTYNNLANVNNNISNFHEALKYNLEALKIREQLNDKLGVANSYSNLGGINFKLQNIKEASKNFLAAFKIYKELNHRSGLLTSYFNFGNLYNEAGNSNEALVNYFEAVKISQELNEKVNLANAYLNIGRTYCELKEFDKALDYNSKALVINKSVSNLFGITRCYIISAITYKALKEFQLSKNYLDSAIRLSKRIGSKELIRDSYEHLSKVDSLENNWLNAYNNYRIFTIYNDSINNKDNTEKIKQSQIQYELEKKDLEYQKLMALKAIQFEYQKKQAAVKTEKEKQKLSFEQQIKEQKLSFDYSQKMTKVQNEQKQQLALNAILAKENNLMIKNSKNESIIRWFMILALFALIAFGFYYYKNFKTQKVSNVIIAKQREDLKALIHELNHRVKNNFQTVASMLSMQTRLLEDTILADVLMQTSNRFLAIASVHEKLYQLESFSDIPIKDYLNDIVTNISTQFGVNKNIFEYEIVDECDLKVNIQTVLPLVLIVNELLTNTFKHAYNPNTFLVIHIFISQIQDNKYQLIYKDNGPGLPQNFSNSTRFGLKLLKLFSEQLRGNIQFKNENGAVFVLAFEYE